MGEKRTARYIFHLMLTGGKKPVTVLVAQQNKILQQAINNLMVICKSIQQFGYFLVALKTGDIVALFIVQRHMGQAFHAVKWREEIFYVAS